MSDQLTDVVHHACGHINLGETHKWFAWRPVTTYDGRLVWLKTVWRRRYQTKDFLDGPMLTWWQITI